MEEQEKDPKFYEIGYLIKADDEQAAFQSASAINEAVEKETGIITSYTQPSKKVLSYPIQKEKEGWWGYIKFILKPRNIEAVKEKIKTNSAILRFSILKTDKAEATGRPKIKRKVARPTTEKTDVEEIDKKLEEILG